jgi:hypothetical protein
LNKHGALVSLPALDRAADRKAAGEVNPFSAYAHHDLQPAAAVGPETPCDHTCGGRAGPDYRVMSFVGDVGGYAVYCPACHARIIADIRRQVDEGFRTGLFDDL